MSPITIQNAFRIALQHHNTGSLSEAEALYRQIVAVNLSHGDSWNNLGILLAHTGRLAEALDAFQMALRCQPTSARAYVNLGNVLSNLGRYEDALTAVSYAIRLNPNLPNSYDSLGNVKRAIGQLDEAIDAYRRSIQLHPDSAEVHSNLGSALRAQGDISGAIAEFKCALRLNSGNRFVHDNLIYALLFDPQQTGQTIAEEHERWNRQFADCFLPIPKEFTNIKDPHRKLRVGYVSPDLGDHVIGRNLKPLFEQHDRERFAVVTYSDTQKDGNLTEIFRRHSDIWRNTNGIDDNTLAEIIRQDAIDILVDLTQHMSGNRLMVFARAPAPVQVSFAGYPESAGLQAIPYRISDRHLAFADDIIAPANSSYTISARPERVMLIDSFWCYDPLLSEISTDKSPAEESGVITFGSLNSICKINSPLLRMWAQILSKVDGSRLVLQCPETGYRWRIVDAMVNAGVSEHRIEFSERIPLANYLALHRRLDIVLDTFPYNGHTTSLDALWMGVPVVSLCGERPVSRAGLSQLSNLGLPELVAFTEDQYVEIAIKLANDLPRLKELRATLRERMEKSVLMDAPHFARQIEACYRSMWRQWCESQKN